MPRGSASTMRRPTRRSTASTHSPTSASTSGMRTYGMLPEGHGRRQQHRAPPATSEELPDVSHQTSARSQHRPSDRTQRLSGALPLAGTAASQAQSRRCSRVDPHRHQSDDAAPGKGILHAPLAHARGRVRIRARGRGRAADRVRRTAAARRDVRRLRGRPPTYLEISNREDADSASYSDPDVDLLWSPLHAPGKYTRRDGTPY